MPGGLEPGVGVISWGESELEWGVLSCAHPTAGLGAGGVGSGEHPPTHKAGSHPLWGPQSCSSYCWGHATPCWSGWAQQGQRGPRAGSKAGRPARGARALQGQCAACQGPALRVLDAEPETSAQVLRAGQGWGGEGGGLQGTHAPRSLRRGILKAAGPWQARGVTVWVGGPKPVGLSDAPLPRACAQPSGTPVPLAPASTGAPAPARRGTRCGSMPFPRSRWTARDKAFHFLLFSPPWTCHWLCPTLSAYLSSGCKVSCQHLSTDH